MRIVLLLLIVGLLIWLSKPSMSSNWYVRQAGGSTTQCTGHTDADYLGTGSTQPCAYSNLQNAIDAATWGDTINVQPNYSITPNFECCTDVYAPYFLRNKGTPPTGTDADYIVIQPTSVASLPSGRVSIADKANMFRLVQNRGANKLITPGTLLACDTGASYWKIVGSEMTDDGNFQGQTNQFAIVLFEIGNNYGVHHIWLDRSYLHSSTDGTADMYIRTETGMRIGSGGNPNITAVGVAPADIKITNSRLSGFDGYYPPSGTVVAGTAAIKSAIVTRLTVDNNFLSATYQPWFPGPVDALNASTGTVQASPSPTLTSATLSGVPNLQVGDFIAFPQSNLNNYACGIIQSISGNSITFTSLRPDYGQVSAEAPVAGTMAQWRGQTGGPYTITHNDFYIDPVKAGRIFSDTESSPKGCMEWKSGDGALIQGNKFDCYHSGIQTNSVNQNGATPWDHVGNLTIQYNWFKSFSAMNFQQGNWVGQSGIPLSVEGKNIWFLNNLLTDVTTQDNTLAMANNVSSTGNMRFEHNTVVNDPTNGSKMLFRVNAIGSAYQVSFKNNIAYINAGFNVVPYTSLFPAGTELTNAIISNGSSSNLTVQTWLPNSYISSSSSHPLTFMGTCDGQATLACVVATAEYKAGGVRQASDGTDQGVDIPALNLALGSIPAPTPTPTPSPSPTPTPTPLGITITGSVTLSGSPLPSVIVQLLRSSDRTLLSQSTTGTPGTYSLSPASGSSVIVQPVRAGYSFLPAEVMYLPINSSQVQNFAAAAPTPTPTPAPTATPTPTPSPTPVPTPTPLLPVCKPNQVIGSPLVCRCLTKPTTGIGNPKRCKP